MSTDLLELVNMPIGQWRDETETSLDDIVAWITKFANQTKEESNDKKERCEICNSRDSLESDHIAGRKHDYRTATLCFECHQWHSKRQRAYGKEWEHGDQPDNLRKAFFLKGLIDLLELKAIKTGNSNYRTLAESYNEIIHTLHR